MSSILAPRRALRRLVIAAAFFAPAAHLAAQTLPLPPLPETSVPADEPPPPGAAPKAPRAETAPPAETGAQPRPQPWEYTLGVGVVEDTNTNFVPDGPRATAIVPGGRFARNLSSAHGLLRVEAAGRWVGFPGEDIPARNYFDGGLSGEYRSSPRTEWRGDAHYWLGYTDSSPTLIDQGVALPTGKTATLSGELALNQKLGARSFLRAEGRVLRADFDDPAFVDGRSLRGTLALGRQLGARDETSLAYSIENVLVGDTGGTSLTHFGSLQWSHTLSKGSALLLEAGASYTPDASQVGLNRSEGFFGGITFHRQMGRSSLTAYLRREVAPAFGLGVSRLANRAGLRAEAPMGRDWQLGVAAYHVQPETPEGEDTLFASSSDVVATLDRRMGRHFTVSGEARYRHRGEAVGAPTVSGLQAGLFLTLGNSQK